jgi:hypothetical protein
MLSENAHVTPSLMLSGNTHCEVEVKKKNQSPSAFFFYKPFCSFCLRRKDATLFYVFFFSFFSPVPRSGTDTSLMWCRIVIAVAVVRRYAHGGVLPSPLSGR